VSTRISENWSGIIKVESTNSPKYDRIKTKER